MTSYVVLVLQFVCFSLWVGGTLVLVLIVIPHFYRNETPLNAGRLLAPLLKRFSNLVGVALVLLIGTLSLQLLFLSSSAALKIRLSLSLTSLALLFMLYNRYSIMARIDQFYADDSEAGREVDNGLLTRMQNRSLVLLAVNLFIGITVVITLILPF